MRWITVLVVLSLCFSPVGAQDPPDLNPFGADPSVDYNALYLRSNSLGIPWDDRNLALTHDDLALLPERDMEDIQNIPLFYRVILRRGQPTLPTFGVFQYPRSSPEHFRAEFGALRRRIGKEGGGEPDTSVTFEGNRNITGEDQSAESAIAVHPTNPDVVIAGVNGPGPAQFHYYSQDGGQNWLPAEGASPLTDSCCDPTLGWSPDGGIAYAATLRPFALNGGGIVFYRSDDSGRSWAQTAVISEGNFEDKEYLHVDTYNCGVNPHCGNIYVSWHISSRMHLARSTDNGDSFATFFHEDSVSGIGSDITTDQQGTVYHFWPEVNERLLTFAASTDGGLTFGPRQTITNTNASFVYSIPSFDVRLAFVHISAATDLTGGAYHNRMYICWNDASVPTQQGGFSFVRVAFSDDGGQNWTVSTPHREDDPYTVDRFNPWMEVDQNGWIHVVYYDTRNDSRRLRADMYHSYSKDGGLTWQPEQRLTNFSSEKVGNSFQWGDYNGLAIVGDQIRPIWTDNRLNRGARVYTDTGRIVGGVIPEFTPSVASPKNGPYCPGGVSEPLTISATPVGGFAQALTYTIEPPLPDGFAVGFSQNPVPIDGTANLIFDIDPFTLPGDYAFRLVASGAGKQRDVTVNLSVGPGPGPMRPIWRDDERYDNDLDLNQNQVIDVLDLIAALDCQKTP